MRKEHYMDVSYWKAREHAQDLIRGTSEENYALLPMYCHMLKEVNIGSYTCLEVGEHNEFRFVFVSIGACTRAFQIMRKVCQFFYC